MTDIEQLLARVGRYGGHGIDHEDQPFHGELELTALLGGRGLALTFRALGIDGATYHDERGWIAPDGDGRTRFWSLSTSTPGVLCHARRHGAPAAGTSATLVFGSGERADALRIEVAFDLWPDGDVGYRYAWGLPGGEFLPRSSVRMSRTD
jgi:hypothetical protein